MRHSHTNQNTGRFQTRLRTVLSLTLALVTLACGSEAFACATCGCSLSTDAAMGYSATTGWRVSADYSFIDQNQLRTGTRTISPSQVAAINDAGGNQEVENQTINRYITLGLSYSSSADWNYRLLLPYIDRSHTTYGAASNPLTPDQISGATVDSLGDIKFIASYQGVLPTHNLGFQLGVKLPTGDYGGPNASGHRHSRAQPGQLQARRANMGTIPSTPACRPAPAAPTLSSVRTTTNR